MKRKVVAMLMATTMALSVGVPTWIQPMKVSAEDVEYVKTTDWQYSINVSGDLEIQAYLGSDTEIEIPAEIDGKSVKSIGSHAFSYNVDITSVTIPDGVLSIGEKAFAGCTNLTDISIPSTVESIGAYVFDDTAWLEQRLSEDELVIVNGILIGVDETVDKVTIPDNVTSIGDAAFLCCENLTTINIPDSVTDIGEQAFCDCINLSSINIPSSVTNIKRYAFHGCSALTSINIPNSVTEIGDTAFAFCESLTSIDIPNSVINIGEQAFAFCKSLTSINIPNSVTNIEARAFFYCENLNSITIPASVISIGENAFIKYYDNCYENLTIYGMKNSVAESYAKENEISFVEISNEQEETTTEETTKQEETTTEEITKAEETTTNKEQVNTTNKVSGVTVKGENLPQDAQLSVVQNSDKSDKVVSSAMDTLGFKEYISFDITLTNKANEAIQPNGMVTVSIAIPEQFVGASNLAIYYVADDGKITKLNSTVKDGYINFETDHFSKYVIVKENEIETSTKVEETTSTVINPSGTGDVAPSIIFVMIMLVSAGVVFHKRYCVNR